MQVTFNTDSPADVEFVRKLLGIAAPLPINTATTGFIQPAWAQPVTAAPALSGFPAGSTLISRGDPFGGQPQVRLPDGSVVQATPHNDATGVMTFIPAVPYHNPDTSADAASAALLAATRGG